MDSTIQDQSRAQTATTAAENILGPNPVVGVRGRDILNTAGAIFRQMMIEPAVMFKHTNQWAQEMVNALSGKSEIAPDKKDRRFQDTAWQESWLHKFAMQTYLATDKELKAWIDDTTLSQLDKERATFVL